MDPRSRSQFFALHVWKEDLGDRRCEWRGRVRHVPSGSVCYFREWNTLVQFLDRFAQSGEEPQCADVSPPGSPGTTT